MSVSTKTAIGFIRGDAKATEKVYLEYRNLLYFVIATYVSNKDDADDVLSAAFLKAMERAKTVKDPSGLKSFLCAIAKNEAIDFVKKRDRVESIDTIDDSYGEDDRSNTLLIQIEPLLTNKEAIVVYYKAAFSYTWEEIVAETGIPDSTARRIYAKAMEKLRKELK